MIRRGGEVVAVAAAAGGCTERSGSGQKLNVPISYLGLLL
jgi:hypothetical protein